MAAPPLPGTKMCISYSVLRNVIPSLVAYNSHHISRVLGSGLVGTSGSSFKGPIMMAAGVQVPIGLELEEPPSSHSPRAVGADSGQKASVPLQAGLSRVLLEGPPDIVADSLQKRFIQKTKVKCCALYDPASEIPCCRFPGVALPLRGWRVNKYACKQGGHCGVWPPWVSPSPSSCNVRAASASLRGGREGQVKRGF